MSAAVFVLATSAPATLRALRKAEELAGESSASIVVLVPHVTAFTPSGDRPANTVRSLASEYRDLTIRGGVDALVHVCVCRRVEDIFKQLVREPSTIVIAGERGSWVWPTAEWRLARALARNGHRVLFEEIDQQAGVDTASLAQRMTTR